MHKYTVLVHADKLKSIIPIPAEFENREVELIISLPRKNKFNPRKYRGIFSEGRYSHDHFKRI